MDTIIYINQESSKFDANVVDANNDVENNLLPQKPTLRSRFVRVMLYLLTKKALRMRGGIRDY